MVKAQRLEKNEIHWNLHAAINGLVIHVVVLFVTCAVVSQAYPTDTAVANNHTVTIDCSAPKTCKKCVEQGSCVWSLERQACYPDFGKPLSLAVRANADCPRVTAVSNATYAARLPYVYRAKVSNDVTGFLEFLKQTTVSCVMLDVTRPAEVSGDTISCAPMSETDLGFDHQTLMTYHCYVVFGEGDTVLRLDDGADSFFTVYDEFRYGYRPDDSCVACVWDVGQYTYNYKWCSSRNTATGRYKYYVGYNNIDRNAAMPVDDRLSATVNASSGCRDVRVRSVVPSSALWTGGARVEVTVDNHSMLADGDGEVRVTVAGRDCVRPTAMDMGVGVTCVLAPVGPGDVRPRADERGPVLIAYGPSSLTVEAAQTFVLIYPEIVAVSPPCGPLSGGTLLTIRGRHLDAGSVVTVAVIATDVGGEGSSSVPCEVIARHSDRLLCLTGPSNAAAVGTVSLVFDGTLRVQDGADGPLEFGYASEPALAAGQHFGGIASGGTAVPVRGTGFACVSNATMYVDRDGVRRVAARDCRPVNDTYMVCGTPKLDGPTAGAPPELLRFGFRVRHSDGRVRDLPPHPDTDGYVAHADPVFEGFYVSAAGRSAWIGGLDLGRGYGAADVAVVGLTENPIPAACNVTAVTRRHVVCESASPVDLNRVPVLVVTIGDHFARAVDVRHVSRDQSTLVGQFFSGSVFLLFLLVYCYCKLKLVNVSRLAETV